MKTLKDEILESTLKIYECASFMEDDGDLNEDDVQKIAELTDQIESIIKK